MRIACNSAKAINKKYVPLPIGNGDLSLLLDFQGSMEQKQYSAGMVPGIRRAGIRYDNATRDLVPFGYFTAVAPDAGPVTSWEQTLDTRQGVVESVCNYQNHAPMRCQTFCHLNRNIIAFRRTFDHKATFRLSYHFEPRRTAIQGDAVSGIHYEIDGQEEYFGDILLLSGQTACTREAAGQYILESTGEDLVFFLVFSREDAAYAQSMGYQALLQEQCKLWEAYWAEGFVEIPSQKMQEVYETAQYHLRISSTKWSVPVGLFDTHWNGRYFGFDEYFAFGGLASTGHLSMAKKIPEFRRSMLDSAINRNSLYFGKTDGSARFVWETVEKPDIEGAPLGFWLEHIFHMSTIALECMQYYKYSGDKTFLADSGYPVMRGCAEFFRLHAVYEQADGKTIIGKCTDLERLGAGRENAFMTTCGAMATLSAAADAAEELGLNDPLIEIWRKIAQGLNQYLPHDEKKYLPYPQCSEKSIAVFAGIFPFKTLPPEDPYLLSAIDDFVSDKSAGNMYPIGNAVCTWYATWMAIVFARLGNGDKALELLESAAESTGCFSEIFEIYETGSHPWFTTAEGSYIQAVNELLVQDDRLLPALPSSWKNLRFRLQGTNGQSHEVVVAAGEVEAHDCHNTKLGFLTTK